MKVLPVLFVTVCSGCASLPSKGDLDKFGEATAKSATVVAVAVSATSQLASEQDEQLQAARYARRQSYALYNLPKPKLLNRVDDAQLAIRVAALDDLKAYGQALAKAADQGTIDELETSAQKLSSSVATLATAVNPGMSPVVAPAIKLTGRAVSYAMADSYVRKILEIVRETDPVIKELVQLLKSDLVPLKDDLAVLASGYAVLRDHQLKTVRRDQTVDRASLYNGYMAARADINARYAFSEAAGAIGSLLQSIYDTHHALISRPSDSGLAIKRFSDLAQDSAAVIEAARKGS
ncbi:hypothetical protein [Agrobacterium rosae]|uniref:hypothetical protein n=1 Tax=Agrobacterium rosae TaxID=1972867 RepID=UPI0020344188|nr:hypothetical protein [Agrobacterium rosae]MCM2435823.1 hypothetical protein [Agrobacterium rosae]